ncbi:MAG TPA: hypothetical protein VFE23_06935 [Usitatibacter sp.]|jgi:hypothetical protein|nr:hypothetical protein [Usitatibacter sp.]
MTATTWLSRLEDAESVAEVVGAARDFLATFTPFEMNALPAGCRPPAKIVDGEDISSYAFDLIRHECSREDEVAALIHRLAHFFSKASIRLSHISAFEKSLDAGEARESTA